MGRYKGKQVMLFYDNVSVALSTSHTLNINAVTTDSTTKDDDYVTVEELDYNDWDASIESLMGSNDNVTAGKELTFASLLAAQRAGKIATAVFSQIDIGEDGAVPTTGWSNPETEDEVSLMGPAMIQELKLSAGVSGVATVSTKLVGVGKICAEGSAMYTLVPNVEKR